jgi:tetratricopeptide (TPR) repeat protein
MPVDLTEAIEQHRRGDLDRAAVAYETALAEEPDRHDALHLLGLVALQRGDATRAAALIGRAVAVCPEEAAYHASLADAFAAIGQFDRALDSYRKALRLRPESPEILCNLGATLVDMGEIEAALGHFHEANRLQPDSFVIHNNLGNALKLKGDLAAAVGQFRRAVALNPRAAEPRSNLGRALLDLGETEEALTHGREAVRLLPGFAAGWNNLGQILHVLGRLEEAGACFREAIRLQPGLAGAHASLGGVLEGLGDFDAAEASLREALRLDPRHTGALGRLATRLRGKLPDADLAAIEGLLAEPGLSTERRRPLAFGLAHVLDARGEFDRAAGLALEANALRLIDFQARGKHYSPDAHRAFVDRLIAVFSPDFFARVRPFGSETERPVFVVGMPRSGTTLVEQVLASHPRVFGAGELRLAQETFEAIPSATGRAGTPLDSIEHLDRAAIDGLARRHLDGLAALDGSADRVVDKMPENSLYLGLIAALFPGAKLIHCRRDPRDVALSCWLTDFAEIRWACDLEHIATRIEQHDRIMDHWRRVLPTPIFEVDYEANVADPDRIARAIVAWCGLEWDPACLEFHSARRPVRTASVAQVRQPVYRTSVGRWKNYERTLAPLFSRL